MNIRLIAAFAVLLGAAEAFAAIDLEWNVHYGTDVPYEVDLAPERIGWENFTVKADGKVLPAQAFDAREAGFVSLRFAVPKGTKRLTCEQAKGKLAKVDSSTVDNVFAGALDAANVANWKSAGGDAKKSVEGGALRLEGTAGRPIVS